MLVYLFNVFSLGGMSLMQFPYSMLVLTDHLHFDFIVVKLTAHLPFEILHCPNIADSKSRSNSLFGVVCVCCRTSCVDDNGWLCHGTCSF